MTSPDTHTSGSGEGREKVQATVEALHNFAEHLEPVIDDYSEERTMLLETADFVLALQARLEEAEREQERSERNRDMWKEQCERQADKLTRVQEALEDLRKSAALLQQNAVGCAVNHYGSDYELHGLPGWLLDTKASIDRAGSLTGGQEDGR